MALFQGDPRTACEQWLTVTDLTPADGGRYLPPAALAAGYAGDVDRARSLLDRAIGAADALGAPSHRAFAVYAAAEMAAGPDPDAATDLYGRAIELARRSGATFVEGVASVGVVRLWGASGRTRQALEGYRRLIHDWQRAGHWTQMWTTLRNAVAPLADAGQPEAAALALAAADAAPEAALVTVDVVAAELAALDERLRRDLGPTRAAALRDRAARMPRTEVVATVLAAVDAALA